MRVNKHRLKAYNEIIGRLKTHSLEINLKILNNEASKEYQRLIADK